MTTHANRTLESIARDSVPGLHQKHDGPGALEERMVVARRLRQLRRHRHLSVVGLAAASVVSKSTLYRIESGGRMPMKKTVLKLSQALGIDPGALFRPDGLRLISSDREPWGHQQRLKHEWTLFPWIRAASK